ERGAIAPGTKAGGTITKAVLKKARQVFQFAVLDVRRITALEVRAIHTGVVSKLFLGLDKGGMQVGAVLVVSLERLQRGSRRIILHHLDGQQVGGHGANRAERRSEEHTSELQSRENLVCRLLLEKKKKK